jgi:hypothetical protein
LLNPVALDPARCRDLRVTTVVGDGTSAGDGREPTADPPPDVVAGLQAVIRRHTDPAASGTVERFDLSRDQERKLRSLGYLQ